MNMQVEQPTQDLEELPVSKFGISWFDLIAKGAAIIIFLAGMWALWH
jgi:hypothetical protein